MDTLAFTKHLIHSKLRIYCPSPSPLHCHAAPQDPGLPSRLAYAAEHSRKFPAAGGDSVAPYHKSDVSSGRAVPGTVISNHGSAREDAGTGDEKSDRTREPGLPSFVPGDTICITRTRDSPAAAPEAAESTPAGQTTVTWKAVVREVRGERHSLGATAPQTIGTPDAAATDGGGGRGDMLSSGAGLQPSKSAAWYLVSFCGWGRHFDAWERGDALSPWMEDDEEEDGEEGGTTERIGPGLPPEGDRLHEVCRRLGRLLSML